jgi:hypothetical protein
MTAPWSAAAGREMKKSVRGALAVFVVICGAGIAWAGLANTFEVTLDATAKVAYGSLYDVRHSADGVQHIGCSVGVSSGRAHVICEARNAAWASLNCWSDDPEMVKAAQALTDNGYVYFTCDASNVINYLYVSKSSVWLP